MCWSVLRRCFSAACSACACQRRIKDDLLGYEPNDFRRLFLQQMDILDGLDEGILAIDKNSTVVYLNRAAQTAAHRC